MKHKRIIKRELRYSTEPYLQELCNKCFILENILREEPKIQPLYYKIFGSIRKAEPEEYSVLKSLGFILKPKNELQL